VIATTDRESLAYTPDESAVDGGGAVADDERISVQPGEPGLQKGVNLD
jgi:hypothetical protein